MPAPVPILASTTLACALLASGCAVTAAKIARTRASHDLRCDPDQIELVELGGTSFRATGCGSSMDYDCAVSDSRTYVCVRARSLDSRSPVVGARSGEDEAAGAPSAAERSLTGPATRESPSEAGGHGGVATAPDGAAGFVFGDTVEDGRKTCEPNFAWKPSGDALFECSGAPKSIGVDATVLVKFCRGALCKLVFLARPDSDKSSDWLHPFTALKRGLTTKYGSPLEDNWVPSRCTRDLLPCIRSGTAHIKYTWAFTDGSFVVLVMSNVPGPDAVIRLTYSHGHPSGGPDEGVDGGAETAEPPAL